MSHRDRPYIFDARSASWRRTTGWERYCREIAGELERSDPLVHVRRAGSDAAVSRLWQDAVAIPAAVSRTRVAHFPTLPAVPWARPQRALVFTIHDLTWWQLDQAASRLGRIYYRRLATRLLRRDVHVVTCTQAVADEVIDRLGLAPERLTVAPLGVNLPSPSLGPQRSRPYVLAVGTVEPRKNLHRLAEAYAISGLAASHDLVLVGRIGWGQPPTGVEIISGVDDVALARLYRGATALVLPSIYEGFGLPAVEALQLGVPVLCSDIPALREVTGNRATYFDPSDVSSIAEALLLAPDVRIPPELAQWTRERFNWATTARILSSLYRRLDSEHGGT